jgi:hypothetical protein
VFAHCLVVGVEERSPPLVAQGRRSRGGADDVGEEHRREDSLDLDLGPLTGHELSDLIQHEVLAHCEVPPGSSMKVAPSM